MELIQAARQDYHALRSLYMEAFPPEERPPFRWLRRRAEKGRVDLWRLRDGSEWAGLACVLRAGDLAYLFFFAIDAARRGQGCGTRALAALRAQYADCRFFLALEQLDPAAPNYAQRLRRHAFYQRCGLRDLPCKIKEDAVVYAVMGMGGPIRPEEYDALTHHCLGWYWRMRVEMRLIEE